MKITDKIDQILEDEKDLPESERQTYYSYEYFPPKTPAGEENLVDRISRMAQTNPLWVDVTWGAGGSTFDTTLDLCGHITKCMGLDVLMHLTCTGMTRERVIESLDKAKEYGIRNILALRGDPPFGVDNWVPIDNGFAYATELVAFIKERYGDYFCVVVAGYPEVHAQAVSREDDIKHLKEKCDAGGDIIITQLFYNNEIFLQWVKDCRAAGITARIIPGLMPILGYDRFQKTIKFCKTNVPEDLAAKLEELKNDDEKVREFGVEHGVQTCKELMEGGCKFLHFYTMNLEAAVIKIIKELGILKRNRELPFIMGTSAERASESVRPIFWANKPSSYFQRTIKWDEFPNGRWGDSKSPAFGAGFEDDESANMAGFVSYTKKFRTINIEEKRKHWGQSCTTMQDVSKVFSDYITGKIKKFPFSEGALALETSVLTDVLVQLINARLFTINSQPAVNGVRSNDAKFGWGPEQFGYVYQKAYFEFFIPKQLVQPLAEFLEKNAPTVSYQAINLVGDKVQNSHEKQVNAVTWGVFPGKEIVQPTVVDHDAFEVWKNEALQAWSNTWGVIYQAQTDKDGKETAGSAESVEFLKNCYGNFYVMNIVENDYIGGDLSKLMLDFISNHKDIIDKLE